MKIEYYFDKPVDKKKILETFFASFGKVMDFSVFQWRFLNNPFSEKVYINYVESDDVLASYYAVSPSIIWNKGIPQKVALSMMTMTHPEYRGKGLFVTLAKELYEVLKKDEYFGVYGFANQNSHYGFRRRLGWQDIVPLSNFSIEKRVFNKRKFNLDTSLTFEDEDLNEASLSEMETLSVTDNTIYLDRTKDYLRWRLIQHPIYNYRALTVKKGNDQIIGILVYKFFEKDIDAIEFFFLDEKDKIDVLIQSLTYLIRKDIEKLNIWSNLYSKEHIMLEKFGFKNKMFSTYFGLIPLAPEYYKLSEKRNWHYRFIDSDLY